MPKTAINQMKSQNTGIDDKDNLAVHSLAAYQNAVNTAAIVSISDKQGNIVFANDLFCTVSKYTRDELIGKNHRIVNSGFHPADFFKKMWSVIAAGKVWHGEVKNKAKDGSIYWVDSTISPIFNNHGDIVQYLSIRTLITDRKELETEKEKLFADLIRKYNELMQFNYIVSHNVKAPINKIIGLVNLLEQECIDSDGSVLILLKYLTETTGALNEVINDVVQILSTGRNPDQKAEEIELKSIVNSVQRTLDKPIVESGAVINIEIIQDTERFISVKSYIHSILYNLFSNAIKYNKKDIPPVISLKARITPAELVFTVEDNGIGINLEKAGADLFGLYKRFNFTKEGKGLGLHMTKTQVQSLGGIIEVESREGIGTKFTVNLPNQK